MTRSDSTFRSIGVSRDALIAKYHGLRGRRFLNPTWRQGDAGHDSFAMKFTSLPRLQSKSNRNPRREEPLSCVARPMVSSHCPLTIRRLRALGRDDRPPSDG